MARESTAAQRRILEAELLPLFNAIVGEGLASQPAAIEHLAATLLVPLEQPEDPEDAPTAFLDVIERQHSEPAAALPAAIAVLATEPLAMSSWATSTPTTSSAARSPSTSTPLARRSPSRSLSHSG
jgi:hypothetical protein